MALFGKKKVDQSECDCGSCCDTSAENAQKTQATQGEGAAVKVLGSGCKKCNELEANTKAALMQLGMDSTIEHVSDFAQIAAYGVMTTPALIVDGKVLVHARVPKTDEILKLIQKART